MDFKEKIQDWLRSEGMLQGTLANKLGMTPQTLSTMLARGNPTLATLHRFRQVMGISMTMFEEPLELPETQAQIAGSFQIEKDEED